MKKENKVKKDGDLFETIAKSTKPEKAEKNNTISNSETIQELNNQVKTQAEITKEKTERDRVDQMLLQTELLATFRKNFDVDQKIINEQKEIIEKLEQQKSELVYKHKTPNLVAAINQVMREVKGIEKTASVGTGNNSFKAVSDKDVKRVVGQAMERAGLAILPISVEPTLNLERWEVSEQWGTQPAKMKRKKEVFTEVKTKYLLMHESGQQIELAGYGQGVDSMDKSAGKATTYALKYALLYAFLIPTGQIDDADKTQPQQTNQKTKQTLTDAQFKKAIAAIGANTYTADELRKEFTLSKDQEKQL
jgi:hypothetical protein